MTIARNFALALTILLAFSCGQTRAAEQTPDQIKSSAAATFTANGAGTITGPNVGTAITNIADSFIPTNLLAGHTYLLQVIQDATGSRTATWDAVYKWGTAGTPTLTITANAVDLVTCRTPDAMNLYCSIDLGF